MKCLKIDVKSGLYSIVLNLQDLTFIRKFCPGSLILLQNLNFVRVQDREIRES
jgi:hypothetical protein